MAFFFTPAQIFPGIFFSSISFMLVISPKYDLFHVSYLDLIKIIYIAAV